MTDRMSIEKKLNHRKVVPIDYFLYHVQSESLINFTVEIHA